MQFRDDWPGLFLRGDDAIQLGARIRSMLEALKEEKVDDARVWAATTELERLAEMIEQEVRVRFDEQS